MADRARRLASGRQARPLRVGPRERPPALQPVLPRGAARAGCPRSCRCPTASSAPFSPDGQQFAYLPQSQAFRTWKRYRGGWAPDIWLFDLTTLRGDERHEERGERRAPDVARRHALLPVGPRRDSATTSGPSTAKTGTVRQVTDFRDFDIAFPAIGPARHRVRGRRPAVPARPRDREGRRKWPSGRDRPHDAQAARARRSPPSSARPASRRPASARCSRPAATSSPCRRSTAPVLNLTRSVGRRRALPALVAGRQDARLLERSLSGEYELTLASCRRRRRRAHAHVARARVPLSAALVARQQAHRVRRSDDARFASLEIAIGDG